MTSNQFYSLPIFAVLTLFFSTQVLAETDCSKEAIGFYLDKGFTPEQVSRMCQVSTHGDTNGSTVDESITSAKGQAADAGRNEDLVFFNKAILSDKLTVTPQTLTYIRDECVRYGEEDIYTNWRPKVCGVLKTTITRMGLVVLRAVKGIPIIRDTELLVKGEIHREVLNLDSLNSKDRETFGKILQPWPETFDIQIREDADPKEIAARLPR